MKNAKKDNGFLLSLLFNTVLNFEWSIPAWILLALHFWLGISLWWFCAALLLWVLVIGLHMCVISWAAKCSVPDKANENKNPYSVGAKRKDDSAN